MGGLELRSPRDSGQESEPGGFPTSCCEMCCTPGFLTHPYTKGIWLEKGSLGAVLVTLCSQLPHPREAGFCSFLVRTHADLLKRLLLRVYHVVSHLILTTTGRLY